MIDGNWNYESVDTSSAFRIPNLASTLPKSPYRLAQGLLTGFRDFPLLRKGCVERIAREMIRSPTKTNTTCDDFLRINDVYKCCITLEALLISGRLMDTVRYLMASRLKHLRKSKGFKQAELAEVMGCEINTISRYETGANTPSIDQLLRLAEALGVSPMELLPPPNPTVQRVLELRQNLADKALQIDSPKSLEQLVQLAEELISTNRVIKK